MQKKTKRLSALAAGSFALWALDGLMLASGDYSAVVNSRFIQLITGLNLIFLWLGIIFVLGVVLVYAFDLEEPLGQQENVIGESLSS